jgi:hypothetical protein
LPVLPVISIMACPQMPHLSRLVSGVGEVTRRGRALLGVRDSRIALTRLKVTASMTVLYNFLKMNGILVLNCG